MVIVAVGGNILIGLACLFVAWQLWAVRRQLASVTATLKDLERSVYDVLHPAPKYILMGQSGVNKLRQNLQGLDPKIERIRTVISLLKYGNQIWLRRAWTKQRPR